MESEQNTPGELLMNEVKDQAQAAKQAVAELEKLLENRPTDNSGKPLLHSNEQMTTTQIPNVKLNGHSALSTHSYDQGK